MVRSRRRSQRLGVPERSGKAVRSRLLQRYLMIPRANTRARGTKSTDKKRESNRRSGRVLVPMARALLTGVPIQIFTKCRSEKSFPSIPCPRSSWKFTSHTQRRKPTLPFQACQLIILARQIYMWRPTAIPLIIDRLLRVISSD